MQAMTTVNERRETAASGMPVALLCFEGDISSASKDVMLGAYDGIDKSVARVLLDFSGVGYINSSGIAIIIQILLEVSRTESRTIGIFGLSPHFQKVFTMVGIHKYATLHNDEVSALAVA